MLFGLLVIIALIFIVVPILNWILPVNTNVYSSVNNICPLHTWEYVGNRLRCSKCHRTPEEIVNSVEGRGL